MSTRKSPRLKANGSATPSAPAPALIQEKEENVFFFIPNLIGYSRIVLAIASLYYMPLHPKSCSGLYTLSCLLDAFDGAAARYYQQSTKFGAVLDMVTDRCTTSCLLVFLATAFPRWSIVFQGLVSLDLSSHYIHMYSTLTMGDKNRSHKKIDKDRSWLMSVYYSNNVLFFLCALNEAFFLSLYLLSFSSPKLSPNLLKEPIPGGPGTASPSVLWTTPWSAHAMELARANKLDSTIPWALAAISCPVMVAKQIINVEQLVKASQWLVEGDRAERKKQGLAKKSKE